MYSFSAPTHSNLLNITGVSTTASTAVEIFSAMALSPDSNLIEVAFQPILIDAFVIFYGNAADAANASLAPTTTNRSIMIPFGDIRPFKIHRGKNNFIRVIAPAIIGGARLSYWKVS